MKNSENNFPIKGQKDLIKSTARAVKIHKNSNGHVRPHFILTGESGSGKSLTVQYLCNAYGLKYIEINAASLTKEGTSGSSVSKALSVLLNTDTSKPYVIFVDEFDKLFISGNSNSDLSHETTNGVQNEFLTMLEKDKASVFGDYGKFIDVDVSKALFIFAGAFNGQKNINVNDLRSFGVKTEFIGRVPLIFHTEKLTLEDLFKILDESVLLANYLKLFQNDTTIDSEKAVFEIKNKIQKNYEENTLGARMVNTLIHSYFVNQGFTKTENDENITFQPMQ